MLFGTGVRFIAGCPVLTPLSDGCVVSCHRLIYLSSSVVIPQNVYWACNQCETIHTQNAPQCRECGHQILRPASDAELQRESSGIEEPEAMDTVSRAGESIDPEYQSSPDVNTDGSLASTDSETAAGDTPGGIGTGYRLLYTIRGFLIAPLALLRKWILPITAFLLVLGIGAYLLV